jgi:Ca2+-binding RTX toxin-like protein
MKRRTIAGSVIGIGMVIGLGLTAGSAGSATITVTAGANTAAIAIPAVGTGTPYPSLIDLGTVPGRIVDIDVVIKGLQHDRPDDLFLVLGHADDGALGVLTADAGCAHSVTGYDLTFDDDAVAPLPDGDADTMPSSGSSVQPTFGTSDPVTGTSCGSSPAPADVALLPVGFGPFLGTAASGQWGLFVSDDTDPDSGQIAGGWELRITTTDAVVTVAASDAAATEAGNTGEFTLTRTGDTTDPLTVNIGSAPSSTATSGSDYTAFPSTATFAAGAATTTVSVVPVDDSSDENDETVDLTVLPASDSSYLPDSVNNTATVTIAGNDHATSVGLQDSPDPSVLGETVTFTATVTRTLSGAGVPVGTVNFTDITGGGATSLCTGVALDSNGVATCAVSTLGVGEFEPVKADFVPADLAIDHVDSGATVVFHTVTLPSVTIAATDGASEPADHGTFTVTRTGPTGSDLTVQLATPTGTATAPGDFVALPSSVKILSGSSTATVDVTPNNDTTWEPSKTIVLGLAGGSDYILGTASSATMALLDDDPAPTTTTLTKNVNLSLPGQMVTLTATVTSIAGTPEGTVDFKDGSGALCNDVELDVNGVATCTQPLGPGKHSLTAAFNEIEGFLPSSSAPLVHTVLTPAEHVRSASGRTCHGVPATIVGTGGPDRITGTRGRDVIVGLGGNDVIFGRGGNDLICGNGGDDIIRGGNGDDRIDGDAGNDALFGQAGDDDLFGDNGDDKLSGGQGDDRVRGGTETDTAINAVGRDTELGIERRG